MAYHLPQPDASPPDTLPHVEAPVARRSRELGIPGYVKHIVMPLLVTKLSAVAGGLLGRLIPLSAMPEWLQSTQESMVWWREMQSNPKPLASASVLMATVTGSVAGFYEAWKHWRKDKSKQLSVQDIHKDVYTELDPRSLQAETEQNQRIQDGIKALIKQRENRPHSSHVQTVTAPENAEMTALAR